MYHRLGLVLRFAPPFLVLATLAALWATLGRADAKAPTPPSNGVIVQFRDTTVQAQAGWQAVYGVPGRYMLPDPSVSSLNSSDIVFSEPNIVVTLDTPTREDGSGLIAALVNDPLTSQQYSLTKMNVQAAWDVTHGDGVVVAILDTGADFGHIDLAGKFVSNGRDFINNDNDASDDHGHGTHVSGIIAAATNNGIGVAGVGYNTRVLPVKVLAANGSGNHGQIASGIMWAADQGARIINLSLGGPYSSQTLEQAVDYAWSKGALVVSAAGNHGGSTPNYPAAYTNVLAVCATDGGDTLGTFSGRGAWVDVCAPGVGILSTVRGGSYESWNGTSMAAPNAAGVAALALAACPTCTAAQLRNRLESTADSIGYSGLVGRGRLNAARAVNNVRPSPTPPVPLPSPTPPTPPQIPADYAVRTEFLINEVRGQYNLPPLRTDRRLSDAASWHNRWMRDNNCFGHQCPGEPTPGERVRNAGYPLSSGPGEIIGRGYQTPEDMVAGWLGSSGHRANILNSAWPDMGCGYLRGPSGYAWDSYWTCNFAKSSAVIAPPTRNPLPTPTATRIFFPTLIRPTATLTTIPWPQPSPVPLWTRTPVPTVTPPFGAGRVAYVSVSASSQAWQDAAALCASGWHGASCQDAPKGAPYLVIVRVASDAESLAQSRMDRLCGSAHQGVRCEP